MNNDRDVQVNKSLQYLCVGKSLLKDTAVLETMWRILCFETEKKAPFLTKKNPKADKHTIMHSMLRKERVVLIG